MGAGAGGVRLALAGAPLSAARRLQGMSLVPAVTELMLAELNARLADRKIAVEATDAAKARLAELGYDPVYGARPLRRAIQKHVQDPLALALLRGEFAAGDTVRIDAAGDGGFAFGKAG